MSNIGMYWMLRFNNKGSTNRLFAEIGIQNTLLNAGHQSVTEKINDSGIHPAIHQPKGIGSTDHTVKGRESLKITLDDLDIRAAMKCLLKRTTEGGLGINKDQVQI